MGLFDQDDDLLGSGGVLRALRGAPSVQGKMRPGRLSTAIKQARKKAAPGTTKRGTMKLPPVGTSNTAAATRTKQLIEASIAHKAAPSSHTKAALIAAAQAHHAAITSRKVPIPPAGQGSRRGRRRIPGLGDDLPADPTLDPGTAPVVPFQANARVWVSSTEVPVVYNPEAVITNQARQLPYSPSKLGNLYAAGQLPQMVWPDGSPYFARYWLPAINLEAVGFSPVRADDGFQAQGDPSNGYGTLLEMVEGRAGKGGGAWLQSDRAGQYLAGATWEYLIDFLCPDPPSIMARAGTPHGRIIVPPPPDLDSYPGQWFDEVTGVCKDANNWFGLTERLRHFASSFDWSQADPSSQAPIWLYLNLFANPLRQAWYLMDAEIYRADLGRVEDAEPNELPGSAWLDLNFLDAIQTGVHGVPVLVRGDGTIDPAALTAFGAKYPAWGLLTNLRGEHNRAMLAIVNDVGQRSGAVVYQPPPPPPAPELPPEKDPLLQDPLAADPLNPNPAFPTGLPNDPGLVPLQLGPGGGYQPAPGYSYPDGYYQPEADYYEEDSEAFDYTPDAEADDNFNLPGDGVWQDDEGDEDDDPFGLFEEVGF